MNYFSKIKLGTWLVIILTAINLAALTTILYKKHCYSSDKECKTDEKKSKKGFKYFVQEMEMDSLQEKYFNKSRCKFFNTSKRFFEKQEDLRMKMIKELTNNSPDTVLLYSICDSMGYNYVTLKKIMLQNFVNFRKMCNDKQKRKLDTVYYKIIRPEVPNLRHKKKLDCDD